MDGPSTPNAFLRVSRKKQLSLQKNFLQTLSNLNFNGQHVKYGFQLKLHPSIGFDVSCPTRFGRRKRCRFDGPNRREPMASQRSLHVHLIGRSRVMSGIGH